MNKNNYNFNLLLNIKLIPIHAFAITNKSRDHTDY